MLGTAALSNRATAMPKRFAIAAGFLAAAFAAGCGQAPPAVKKAAAPIEKGIFISTNDCIDAGKIPEDACIKAVDTAVAIHESKAASYKTLQTCAKAEGADGCDKTVNGQYRARLQAFLITLTVPPAAEPLYPLREKKKVGFRSPTQKMIDAQDDTLIVSASALAMAHDNSKQQR